MIKHQIQYEVPIQSASTSTLLNDLMDELGIETPRRYISDDIASWYVVLDFRRVYCVDEVLSLRENTETYRWECSEDGCELTPCDGPSCDAIKVSVVNGSGESDALANCGNSVKISVPKTVGKVLDFGYLGIAEIAVIGQLYEEPTSVSPTTSTPAYEHDNLELNCDNVGKSYLSKTFQNLQNSNEIENGYDLH